MIRTPAAPEAPSLPLPGGRGTAATMAAAGLALALTLTLTSPATAQVIPTGTPAADILLSRAIAEHRTFLTCSALDPETHGLIRTNWQRDVAAAAAILTANNVPPEAIAAFTASAAAENLLPADDTPWAAVTGLCATDQGWQTRYHTFDFTILERSLPGTLE